MSVIRSKRDRNNSFTVVQNKMVNDPNLSLKLIGLITYCISKPDDWVFYVSQMASKLKDKETSIHSGINELIALGYAIRYQTRKDNGDYGSWETIISDSKEEIARTKEELKDNPDFQKSFTEGGFTDPRITDPRNPVLLKTKEQQKNNSSVCSDSGSGDPIAQELPKEKVVIPREVKRNIIGKEPETFSLEGLFNYAINMRMDWTTAEIKDAWEIFTKYTGTIHSMPRFIEGTIQNLRKKDVATKINNKTKENTCHKKKSQDLDTEHSKTQQDTTNESTSKNGTVGRHLQNWKSMPWIPKEFRTT